jgi:hypothetical protein
VRVPLTTSGVESPTDQKFQGPAGIIQAGPVYFQGTFVPFEGLAMGLMQSYLTSTKKVETFLNTIATAQAPQKFTTRFLIQLDFSSASDRLFIGVLKGLGFLDEDGAPTPRYYKFLDQTQSGAVLAEAIREAYSDLFAINTKAYELSEDDVKNKLRTLTQGQKSDKVLSLMANTFKAFSDRADWEAAENATPSSPQAEAPKEPPSAEPSSKTVQPPPKPSPIHGGLHYNIQIHLPESRDPAVYDAVFRALKEHIL